MDYDCLIIGGGIAGLQAAIQLGRYQHEVLVIDAGNGRSTLCRDYHNLLGWPDGVSGEHLRNLGRQHATNLGVKFVRDEVIKVEKDTSGFSLHVKQSNEIFTGKTLLFATGVLDRFPPLPGLVPCLGLSVYICPDCDGYEVNQRRTMVLGSGDAGASMAIGLTYWTKQLIYINHEQMPISNKLTKLLGEHQIEVIMQPVREIMHVEGEFQGVQLMNGQQIKAEKAFIAFGGNHVRTELVKELGIERMENNHIITDPRTKLTNVPLVWAAGDIGVHSEQVTIAMGEGSQAAIWMHKKLMKLQKELGLVHV